MAIASMACSIRSRRLATSEGMRGFLASASIFREYAFASGIPLAKMVAVTNAQHNDYLGFHVSFPLGGDAVDRYTQLNLRSFPNVLVALAVPSCVHTGCRAIARRLRRKSLRNG